MKILIIEDEKLMRISLADAVLEAGYYCIAFDNPKEAFDAFKESGVDVVVTDLGLPYMNGLELTEKIKSIRPETQVIVMTADVSTDTAAKAMKVGAYAYLAKPFYSEELIQMLNRLQEVCI